MLSFHEAIADLIHGFVEHGYSIHPARWQGMDVSAIESAAMHELFSVSLRAPMPTEELDFYRKEIRPSLPWADEHFVKERASGLPINPGTTWKSWPWGQSATRHLDHDLQRFNHTYAERYWPKLAGDHDGSVRMGIRYPYGDLKDIVKLLAKDPLTRQAVLSVWHPEDQGSHEGRRPCSLTYHFMLRHGQLHVIYSIRSCDILRHMRDDIYLTVRLLLWVLDEVRNIDRLWLRVKPGTFTMHIGSLHCFVKDLPQLQDPSHDSDARDEEQQPWEHRTG